MRCNSMSFTSEEIEKGYLDRFVKFLTDLDRDASDSSRIDIHIYSDDKCCVTVEWVRSFGEEGFYFVDEDQHVMTEVFYPDNSSEMVFPDDVELKKKEWDEAHPDYNKWVAIRR